MANFCEDLDAVRDEPAHFCEDSAAVRDDPANSGRDATNTCELSTIICRDSASSTPQLDQPERGVYIARCSAETTYQAFLEGCRLAREEV